MARKEGKLSLKKRKGRNMDKEKNSEKRRTK